jgi:multiple sugar transport system substrate-binding protein
VGLIIYLLIILTSIFLKNRYQEPQPVEISILLPGIQSPPIWKELITDFEEEYPNISIKMVQTSDETNIVRDIYKKSSYDLVYMDIIWVSELAKEGYLVALSEKFSHKQLRELEADFLQKDWEGGLYQKKLYRIPFRSDVGLLYYRKDLLKKLGYNLPPNFNNLTFKNLIEISEQLRKSEQLQKTDPDLWGYVWQGSQYEGLVVTFVEVLRGYGGFWINNKTNEVGLDKDQAFRAVQFLHDTIHKNRISPTKVTSLSEANSMFANGKAVFLRSWPDFWAEGNKVDSEIKNKFDVVSMVDAEKNSISCQGGWGLGISSRAKHKDEAFKAIKFFTRVNTQRKFALRTGSMPSRRSLLNDLQLVKRYSYYPKLLEISQNSVLRPSISKYSEASKILQTHLSSVLNNPEITQEKIEKEMTKAASKTRELLYPSTKH